MTDDDEDDENFLLFDDNPEDSGPVTNWLMVPRRAATSEQLNEWEEAYRFEGHEPMQFIETDEASGETILGNAAEYARWMGLAPGTPVSVEQADAWVARWSIDGRFTYWDGRTPDEAARLVRELYPGRRSGRPGRRKAAQRAR
jgi:hypothetical protein